MGNLPEFVEGIFVALGLGATCGVILIAIFSPFNK